MKGHFTVFAPTNEILSKAALGGAPADAKNALLSSHVLGKDVPAVELYDGQKIESLNSGRFIHVTEIEMRKWKNYKYRYYEVHTYIHVYLIILTLKYMYMHLHTMYMYIMYTYMQLNILQLS